MDIQQKLKTALARSIEDERAALVKSFIERVAKLFNISSDEVVIDYDEGSPIFPLDEYHRLSARPMFVCLDRKAPNGKWGAVGRVENLLQLAKEIERFQEKPKWKQWLSRWV